MHSLDHVWGSACRWPTRTWLILSFFPSLRERVWTSRKHIFCSRLPFRKLAPTFHASSSPFSLICSRTRCSLVASLHCDPISLYVRLHAAGLPWRSRVLYVRWRFSTYLWIAMSMRTHLAHVAVEVSDHSPNFLDTLRKLSPWSILYQKCNAYSGGSTSLPKWQHSMTPILSPKELERGVVACGREWFGRNETTAGTK